MKRKFKIPNILSMATAILLMMPACNSSYPGIEYEPNPDDQPSNEEDITLEKTPIKIYTDTPGFFSITNGTKTRGTGAFEEEDIAKYLSATFHVFAFRTGVGEDGMGGQPPLTEPVNLQRSAYSTNKSQADPDNRSCLLDGEDYNIGMPFKFIPDENSQQLKSLQAQVDYPLYYSGSYQDVGYSFFGYHIDDFEPTAANTHRNDSEIYYDIDIDGSRDILLGYAEPLKKEDFKNDEATNIKGEYADLKLSNEEVDRILEMHGGYSSYSGHRLVYPIIKMKHQLTRLKFEAYPGDNSASNVKITEISVCAPKKAKMVVAGRRLSDVRFEPYYKDKYSEDADEIWLSEAPAEVGQPCPGKLRDEGYTVQWEDYMYDVPALQRPMTQIGSSLMLAPCKTYDLYLSYTFTKADGEEKRFKAHYVIQAPKNDGLSYDPTTGTNMFMPGIQYNIKIAVFGLQDIQISAAVSGWKEEKDPIVVDPDQNPDYQ